ncbi:MAG: CoA-binding protein [Geitlerinemataceae cyanobacterium]
MNVSARTRVLIQGITEPLAQIHAERMRAYGTQIVAAVSPGYGDRRGDGATIAETPVFDTVDLAVQTAGAIDFTAIFVPPYQVLDAAREAIAAGIRHIAIVTDGVPPMDTIALIRAADAAEALVLGPGSTGAIVPGACAIGTHPVDFYTPGTVGIIGRSSTLDYEVALTLSEAGIGQSICVGLGGDGILGSSFSQWLQILDEDDRTEAIVLVGRVGGTAEELAARYVEAAIDKPVVAYVAGRHAGDVTGHFGHAGEIVNARISGIYRRIDDAAIGTAQRKIEAFQAAGIRVASRPSELPQLLKQATSEVTSSASA